MTRQGLRWVVAGAFVLLPDRDVADETQRQREPTGPPLESSSERGDNRPMERWSTESASREGSSGSSGFTEK